MPITDYLTQVLNPLLTRPEKVKIIQSEDDLGTLLTLTVAREDMGTIIGKGGETARCIRHLVLIAGIKQNIKVSVKITEPDGSPFRPRHFREGEPVATPLHG